MPSFFPEGNAPAPQDNEERMLHKIVGSLDSIATTLSAAYATGHVGFRTDTTGVAAVQLPSVDVTRLTMTGRRGNPNTVFFGGIMVQPNELLPLQTWAIDGNGVRFNMNSIFLAPTAGTNYVDIVYFW